MKRSLIIFLLASALAVAVAWLWSSLENKPVLQEHVLYFSNGLVRARYWEVNGRHHGVYLRYFTNGCLSERMSFSNGVPNGMCEAWWFETMKKRSEDRWKNGMRLNSTFWDTNGSMIGTLRYVGGVPWDGIWPYWIGTNNTLSVLTYREGLLLYTSSTDTAPAVTSRQLPKEPHGGGIMSDGEEPNIRMSHGNGN